MCQRAHSLWDSSWLSPPSQCVSLKTRKEETRVASWRFLWNLGSVGLQIAEYLDLVIPSGGFSTASRILKSAVDVTFPQNSDITYFNLVTSETSKSPLSQESNYFPKFRLAALNLGVLSLYSYSTTWKKFLAQKSLRKFKKLSFHTMVTRENLVLNTPRRGWDLHRRTSN